jgi:hypothetical protein
VQHSSRVSAWRRELNSHEAASPQIAAAAETLAHGRRNAPPGRREDGRPYSSAPPRMQQPASRKRNESGPPQLDEKPHRFGCVDQKTVLRAPAPAEFQPGQASAHGGYKTPTVFSAQRGDSCRSAKVARAVAVPTLKRTPLPNPSLKPTRYGRRCKPGPRHMVHHRSPGLQRLPPRAA